MKLAPLPALPAHALKAAQCGTPIGRTGAGSSPLTGTNNPTAQPGPPVHGRPTQTETRVPSSGQREKAIDSADGSAAAQDGSSEPAKHATFLGTLQTALERQGDDVADEVWAPPVKTNIPVAKPTKSRDCNLNAVTLVVTPSQTNPLPLVASFQMPSAISALLAKAQPKSTVRDTVAGDAKLPAFAETASNKMQNVEDAAQVTNAGQHAFSADISQLEAKDKQAIVEKHAPAIGNAHTEPAAKPEENSEPSPSADSPAPAELKESGEKTTGADSTSALPAGTVSAHNAPINPSSAHHTTAESVRPARAIESDLKPAAPGPMKNISLQLPGSRGVEVRLTERAGGVHVAVHSQDPHLTQALRGNLHELVSGLERKGYSAAVSRPDDHVTAPTTRSQESGNDTGQNRDRHSQASDQGQQEQERRKQAALLDTQRASRSRAAWHETLDSKFEAVKR